jgi:hypothetical protein
LPAICTDLKKYGLQAGQSKTLVLKSHAFRIVFRKHAAAASAFAKKLEVIGITILLARIHVDQHGHGPIPTCQQGSGPDQQESREKPGPLTLRCPILNRWLRLERSARKLGHFRTGVSREAPTQAASL